MIHGILVIFTLSLLRWTPLQPPRLQQLEIPKRNLIETDCNFNAFIIMQQELYRFEQFATYSLLFI